MTGSRKLRTLIINGSPHEGGNTAALAKALTDALDGEVVEVSAFHANVAPCIDCRGCWKTATCVVRDDMDLVYADDFDNVVLASPIYFGTLPGAVLSLASRLQTRRAQHVANASAVVRPKKAVLLLAAGGRGDTSMALHHARCLFKMMNATGYEDHVVVAASTDTLPAEQDLRALARARMLGKWLNEPR